jgi:hypothetical protein
LHHVLVVVDHEQQPATMHMSQQALERRQVGIFAAFEARLFMRTELRLTRCMPWAVGSRVYTGTVGPTVTRTPVRM